MDRPYPRAASRRASGPDRRGAPARGLNIRVRSPASPQPRQHEGECRHAQRAADGMKTVPPPEKLVRVTNLTFGMEVQQAFVCRKDDEERERHDGKQQEC